MCLLDWFEGHDSGMSNTTLQPQGGEDVMRERAGVKRRVGTSAIELVCMLVQCNQGRKATVTCIHVTLQPTALASSYEGHLAADRELLKQHCLPSQDRRNG